MSAFKHIALILIITFCCTVAFGGVIVLEGHYQNQNIYVKNEFAGSGVGFCTYEVTINGNTSTDEINSSAFEIDLAQYHLEAGSPVTIRIKYKEDNCVPKVLNPFALKPNPTFETVDIKINNKGLLTWSSVNENTTLPYVIEQFKWNKWVQVGVVQGKGKSGQNTYSFQSEPVAGVNKFRVKQKGHIANTRYTPPVSFTSLRSEVSYVYNKSKQTIDFSEDTHYEIYDMYGRIVKKGFGRNIEVDNLKKATYYMNFGNTMAEVRKK